MMGTIAALIAAIMISAVAFSPAAAAQDGYAPRSLYDIEALRLDNGMRVLLKQRSGSRTVAYRLMVRTGTRHFDCDLRETPHLIEHLLFSGTSRHTEAELDRTIADMGGSWNAVTGAEFTVFQLDIFDRSALQGLGTLHEIITDTAITPEKFDRVKDIVYREGGGRPGRVRRLLYAAGIGKSAWKKANEWLLPGTGAVCPGLLDLEGITPDHAVHALRTAYVPENMTLIAVGNFERAALLERIRDTFGSLPTAPKPSPREVTPPAPSPGPASVSSTLTPFFGSSGGFSIAFRTVGREHPDAAALVVLGSYLNTTYYEEVRVKAGLSYAPEAFMFFQPDYGVLYATADTNVRDMDRVRELMLGIVERIRQGKVTAKEVERTKRRILLRWVQGFETDADLASLHEERAARAAHRESDGTERLPDVVPSYESEIEAVSAEAVNAVIAEYLGPERLIEIRSVPTVSYTRFFVITGGIVLLAGLAAFCRWHRARQRKKSTLPLYIR